MTTTKQKQRGVPVFLILRTHHIDYLAHLCDRHYLDRPHEALARVIEQNLNKPVAKERSQTPKVSRLHTALQQNHLAFIDRMAKSTGVERSDVVRRLLDEALAGDPTI